MKQVLAFLSLFFLLSTMAVGQSRKQETGNTYESLSRRFQQATRPAEEFGALAKIDQKNPLVWHFLGQALDEMGHEQAACEALETARDLDPRQAWHAQSLADHYFGAGDFEQSHRFYQLAISLETRPQVVSSLKSALVTAQQRADLDATLKDQEHAAVLHTWILGILGLASLAACVILAPRFGK